MAKKMDTGRKQPLNVAVEGDQVVIRIGIDVLAYAIAAGDAFHKLDDDHNHVRTFAIIDNERFARDVVSAMESEAEDGSSMVTGLIEQAAQDAIDDGSIGVDLGQRVAYGQRGKGEKF